MFSKSSFLISLALLVAFAANATAAENDWWWIGLGDTNSWNDINNWDVGTIPIETSLVYHAEANGHILIDSNVPDALCYRLCLGKTWEIPAEMPCYLDVIGGNLTVLEQIRIGARDGDNIYQGVLNASGGNINVSGSLLIGNEGGVGTVDINDGVINVGKTLWLPVGEGSSGTLYLNGGTISATDFNRDEMGTPQMDITEGELILSGNKVTKITDFIHESWLTAYGSRGSVLVDYNSTDDKTTITGLYDPNIAFNPSPIGKDWPYTTSTLSWSPGDLAAEHHVYLGTRPDALSLIYEGTDTNCSPDVLQLGRTYYWRVDEVNGPTTWTGNIWNFSTEEYLTAEDFDSYANNDALVDVWEDYWVNGTCSEVFLEAVITRDGNSMKYDYGNYYPPYYSEIEADVVDLEIGQDWEIGAAEALVLYFHGVADNNDEPMYLTVEDASANSGTVKYDTNDLSQEDWEDWRIWNIDLQDFRDANVALENVSRISILIGEKDRTQPAGSGTIYIDDIRLYPSRCVFEYTDGDINGDCVVGPEDLDMISGDWLVSEYDLNGVDPGADGLLVWYKFDEGSGNIAADSANIDANDYNSTPFSSRSAGKKPDIKWSAEGINGTNCVWFDRDEMALFSLDVPTGFFGYIDDEMTISLWINGDEEWQPQPDGCVFEGFTWGYAWYEGRIPSSDGSVSFWTGSSYLVWNEATPSDWEGQWNHYAFIFNSAQGTRSIYCNAELVAHSETLDEVAGMENGWFTLGSYWEGPWGRYSGKLDELRVYNRSLSQAELIYLADKTSMHIPLARPEVDLATDGKIDFKDYAVMADNWLDEQLWP